MVNEHGGTAGPAQQGSDDAIAVEGEGRGACAVADFLGAGGLAAGTVAGDEQSVAVSARAPLTTAVFCMSANGSVVEARLSEEMV
ncbi:hypothetical protein [Aromatoleum aromaticum]|uniref:hypothetical protein n=1 Tax=Aromatoleum aromaticum TaxID=551760 RepID=UPI001459F808|nr:hypothetical protein [Aromatoleum aromaticum]NMG55499.1 hypothetical protein [Aromatoleum aromaticum]